MSLVAALLADYGVDTTPPVNALQRRAVRELQQLVTEGDLAITSDMEAADELQSIAIFVPTVSGGDFTLEFVLANAETFTTAAIAYNANAATIETAIDTAATSASITGWTNGDISVAGGDLTTNPVTVTFDGNSVKEANHALIVMDDGGLTGGGSGGAITTTTHGQSDRPGWSILKRLSIIGGTIPAEGVTPTALTAGASPDQRTISAETIRLIASYVADTEGNTAIYDAIVEAANVQ